MTALRLVDKDDAERDTLRVLAAADGDEEARSWLLRRWTPPIFRFVHRMVGDEQDAAEIAQDVMVRVLRNLKNYDASRNFATWIYGIARNACIDAHRRSRYRRTEPLGEPADSTTESALTLVHRAERAEQLTAALNELPPMYREVLVLFHFEHMKYAEIADALDLPMGTLMNRIFRARQKLKEIYERNGLEVE